MTKTRLIEAGEPLEAAARALCEGSIVAYPTETFYALGVDPFNLEAVNALYRLKGRAFSEPIPLIISDNEYLERLTGSVPPQARRLMEAFWPGPLTIVLPASGNLPEALTGGSGTIGARVSGAPVARELARAAGGVITATSANPSGMKGAATAGEVARYFDGRLDFVIDGGRLPAKKGSTIIRLTGARPEILRHGEIEAALIEDLLGSG